MPIVGANSIVDAILAHGGEIIDVLVFAHVAGVADVECLAEFAGFVGAEIIVADLVEALEGDGRRWLRWLWRRRLLRSISFLRVAIAENR